MINASKVLVDGARSDQSGLSVVGGLVLCSCMLRAAIFHFVVTCSGHSAAAQKKSKQKNRKIIHATY